MSPRFDMNADTEKDALAYLHERAVQSLFEGFTKTSDAERLHAESGVCWGVRAFMKSPEGEVHQSVYVLASQRGEGHFSRSIASTQMPFVTSPGCDLEAFFLRKGVRHCVIGAFTNTLEYKAIEQHYGASRARRSGVMFMHHIDEGLAVLRSLNASDQAKRAWCLHPLLQADADLQAALPRLATLTEDPYVLVLAMEYRRLANAYLSHREITSISEIDLGVLPEVVDMLRADKVQNYKDFLAHHAKAHRRRDALDRYFRHWLARLAISDATFERYVDALTL